MAVIIKLHQGRTGTESGPGQFPTTTLPALPTHVTSTLPTQPCQN